MSMMDLLEASDELIRAEVRFNFELKLMRGLIDDYYSSCRAGSEGATSLESPEDGQDERGQDLHS